MTWHMVCFPLLVRPFRFGERSVETSPSNEATWSSPKER